MIFLLLLISESCVLSILKQHFLLRYIFNIKQFKNRKAALSFGLNELKTMMTKRIGSTETSNDKQPIILATLRDIEKAQLNMVQLSLF